MVIASRSRCARASGRQGAAGARRDLVGEPLDELGDTDAALDLAAARVHAHRVGCDVVVTDVIQTVILTIAGVVIAGLAYVMVAPEASGRVLPADWLSVVPKWRLPQMAANPDYASYEFFGPLVIVWVLLNLGAFAWQWDPYPFILLNLAFSTQAAYAAPLILLAQNRQENRDRVALEEDRRRAEQTKADTEFLARELAALRIAVGEVATRDYVRRELEDIRDLLTDLHKSRGAGTDGSSKRDTDRRSKKNG